MIDDVTAGQFSDKCNHALELCMDSIQAYVGKQYSMLPVGIRSRDIPFFHRDGKVRASILISFFNFASWPSSPSSHPQSDMNTLVPEFLSLQPFLSLSLSIYLSLSLYLSIYLSNYLSIYLSPSLSMFVSVPTYLAS